MRVVVLGASGFIGRHLTRQLEEDGHRVVIVRRPYTAERLLMVLEGEPPAATAPIGADTAGPAPGEAEPYAVVNLAGESIDRGRWTRRHKARILSSRLTVTQAAVTAIRAARRKPAVLVNASAVGYYGTSGVLTFDEQSGPGTGFLADVCKAWEEAARAAAAETRVVLARFGMVLGPDGGALPRIATLFRLGLGGRVGSGEQWVSWVHVADAAGLVAHCLTNAKLAGPVNVVAPHPVRMDTFTRALAHTLHRPHGLSAPAPLLRFMLGEKADLLLTGQCVLPRRALAAGYTFRFANLESALADLLGRME
ncbi:epimerase [Alicyclobacillus cellulosilyticus]|uniref:Epimerase n=1 Tax=Alicyclobacillus cellulosilyticus TaxID=1003997 RepID=A0A917NKM2_9BACL|nr:TIGR01777 family oxidoreductase [Alicyclobacillus cellulosilyticus]GGJ07857.1 epimerase [Alicyclobacillus cellulosilyticus]